MNELYQVINRNLLAKFIEELQFEDYLSVKKTNEGFSIELSEVEYRFEGKLSIWNQIWVSARSIEKWSLGQRENSFSVLDFIREVNSILKMDDQTLAKFLEEANQTLYSDYQILSQRSSLKLEDFLKLSFTEKEQLLDGHPKLLLNKGRLGWGIDSLEKYSPESKGLFKLKWLWVKEELVHGDVQDGEYPEKILEAFGLPVETKPGFVLFPVHPWQWQRYIKIQFFEYLNKGLIEEAGFEGADFHAQASIRTLMPNTNKQFEVKTSLSILNTSCVRGIPHKYIGVGRDISKKLKEICRDDSNLKNVLISQELLSFSVNHPGFSKIQNCSYRYHEFMGFIVRESSECLQRENEVAISAASLMTKLAEGSVIKSLIQESRLTPLHWIREYFEEVVIPLYHLQICHGIGIVAHGQNIIVLIKDSRPSGIILKDFHGDLRLSEHSIHKNSEEFRSLTRLPREHLIHDLFTGHFVTFLRYLSRLMDEEKILNEAEFYGEASRAIDTYDKNNNKTQLSLKKEVFEKLIINGVRFKVGYSETSARPLPMLANDIINPMILGGI
ncbi:MAG: hypothetical protein CME65_15190 [Halobacteriovoraceae bacterium]|nr:hypothetical protein [Halobacteriovoraceae bacterium]|tara:strand:- start:9876 stop:11543 length:1668 start_codon:yes stop_codon:yes gene_type:complete